ncbi:inactive tyrosine-protein kinase PRAG1-like isoform X1 [Huso huso]|uniref:Inactive tyrosine-protein kinase PRAG1-like isoform X1 n=1 Tax=Huso huso TaxID=61971 RepID=A0ABR1A6V6_HUSHU
MPEDLKMSVCSDFTEHVWKPGFCKTCFYPRSSHRVQRPFEIAANNSVPSQSVKEVWNKTYTVQTEDDYAITSASYSKPTIAVKPTMMNSDVSDMWTDGNVNATDVQQSHLLQHNQKSPTEKQNMMQVLDLSKLYINNNNTNKSLKDVIYQKATGDALGYPKGYSPGALPPLDHKGEALGHPLIISNIFMSQEEGRGPQTFKENGTTPCKGFRQELTRSVNSTYFNGDLRGNSSVETPDVRTLSSGSCDSHRETSSCCSTGHSWDQPGLQNSLESHGCSDRRGLSLVSEAASLSDSCSCQSSSDCLNCSQELEYLSHQRCETAKPCKTYTKEIGRPQKLGPFLNQPLEQLSVQVPREPIYAESTKKKKRTTNEIPRSPDQDQIPNLFHKKPDGFDNAVNLIDCSSGDSSQRAKITVMAAHTEEDNRTFYLSSPDSAVSTQWQHFSPNSTQEPSFPWPQSNSQSSEAGLTDKSGALVQPRTNTQPSPAIPPKQSRGSCSPKLGLPTLSEGGKEENEPSFQAEVHRSSFPFQSQNRNSGDMLVSAAEKRHKYYNTCWSRECKIVEEEEGGEETAHQQSRAADIVNGAVVSGLDSKLENAAAVSFSKEYNNPGTAYNSASHHHAGRASEQDKYNTNMLSKAASFTSEFAEETSETNDLAPPPPPPKKHHRESSKWSQSSSDLEKASHGSAESLTQSLKGLNTSFATASTDSLHSESRMFHDGSHEGALSPSPSHFSKNRLTSSPVSPQSDNSTISYGNSLLPPPLPQKKMVNRAVSAPDQPGGRSATHPRSSPHLIFSNSEGNVYGQDRSQFSSPSSPVDQRHLYSSNESLERCHPPLGQQLRSRTMEEVAGRNKSRLGLRNKSGASFSSSPQLSVPSSGSNIQLHTLLSNIDNREGVYAKLSSLYAESLRRLALKCEDRFTRDQKNPLRFDESNWSLFKLTCNKPCCDAGDSVYYSASCAKDTKNTYAVKICKNQNPDSKQGHLYGLAVQQDLPPHFNLQQDCGHFIACVPQSMLPPDEAAGTASSSQHGAAASTGRDTALPNHNEQERVVVITRDVAYQSTADFVKEWATFHGVQPEVYERRVCFLLLQLCNGLEHLKEHGVIHRDLCLENLLLVHNSKHSPSDIKDQRHLPRLVISSFAKAKQRAGTGVASDPKLKKDQARLAPEIVSASQYKKFDEFQTGILIYELLHQPNPFEVSPKLKEQEYYCEELPKIPDVSIYSAGLQQLACLLLEPDPIKRIHIQEAKRILQSLLWGPRKDLIEQQWDHQQGGPVEGLHNWLNLKRALLMMKFAERSLEPEQSTELEDWLCCQYFASANPISLCHTAELLHFCE